MDPQDRHSQVELIHRHWEMSYIGGSEQAHLLSIFRLENISEGNNNQLNIRRFYNLNIENRHKY